LARELTKKFEEVFEADINEAISHFEQVKPKGEFVVILDGKALGATA
jgi:16S rRNA (cytidine1402-2'-O)-methyltransferase